MFLTTCKSATKQVSLPREQTLLVLLASLGQVGHFKQQVTLCDSVLDLFPSCIYKGKAISLQAWGGPEGSKKLRFPDFVTTAQDGGKVMHRPHLPPGNSPGTHFC
jgi:hypothetical protein